MPPKKISKEKISFIDKINNALLSVKLQEQILFARHLSIMAKSGMSILDSLQLLKKQARSKGMQTILTSVITSVSNGQFLSVALEPYKRIFGDLFINIIRIGETSGTLPENLNYLALELSKKKQLRSKIKSALVYPIIILVATLTIVTALVVFIFPKIIPVFNSLHVELPIYTRILIKIASFATDYTAALGLGLLGFALSIFLLLKIKKVRYGWHWLILHLPVLSKMSKDVNMASLSRTLGLLLKSGVKIVEAVGITGNTLENMVYKARLEEAAEVVRKGGQISEYMEKNKSVFPLMLSQMISVGESTGNLSETLLYLADFYEEEVDNSTKNLSTILEPALLIIMGGIVGFVAISIITPIYGITQGIK